MNLTLSFKFHRAADNRDRKAIKGHKGHRDIKVRPATKDLKDIKVQ